MNPSRRAIRNGATVMLATSSPFRRRSARTYAPGGLDSFSLREWSKWNSIGFSPRSRASASVCW